MIVLHAAGTRDGCLVWAEDSELLARATGRADGNARRHPFALAAPALASVLGQRGSTASDVEVLLPTGAAGAPLPSPDLRGAGQSAQGDRRASGPASADEADHVRLSPWSVPSLCPADPGVLSRLAAGTAGQRLAPSALYLIAVGGFAASLVRRGRVLPHMRLNGEQDATACWRPVLAGTDAARFSLLRDEMPPAFQAAAPPGTDDDPRPGQLLHSALDYLVDAAVRRQLKADRVRLVPPGRYRAADQVAAARWLRALTGQRRFTAPDGAAERLASRLAAWGSRVPRTGGVRVCFRLHEPADSDAAWRLEFLLQATDDPSLLMPATRIWRGADPVLRRWTDRPEEDLLAGLGGAEAAWPALGLALQEMEPSGMSLTVAEAYDFLVHAEPLDAAGFGVLLPAWWMRRYRPSLTLNARTRNPVTPVPRDKALDLGEIVDFWWGISLGGVRLTSPELAELAAAKIPLLHVRGHWRHVDPQLLATGLELVRRGEGRMPAGEVLRYAGLQRDPDGTAHAPDAETLPQVTDVHADGWLGALLNDPDRRGEFVELVGTPAGLGVTLRPYQERGLAWLAFLDRLGIGAILADDMGLGKTVQSLALELLGRAGGPRPPTLVVCPLSVIGNWQREAALIAPALRPYVHHGPARLTADQLSQLVPGQYDLVLTSYTVAMRDHEALSRVTWDRIIFDEAQNVKNAGTLHARLLRRLPARHRLALTGTPVENQLADLWAIMDLVNPGLLGTAENFRARYAVPVERYDDDEAAARLRRTIRPVTLRRVKSDPAVLADLPEKSEIRELCTLTVEQASLYQAVVDQMLQTLATRTAPERKGIVLASITKLKQVCNHPAHLLGDGSSLPGRSGKLDRLEEILRRTLAQDGRALCFTQFSRFAAMLVPHLASRLDCEVLLLHGGTPKHARDAMIQRFQAADGPRIFVLSLKAGGAGLNLTAANLVVHVDRWWNPAAEAQATDRAYRIGQRRHVEVRTLLTMGTIEERIDRMLADKAAIARQAVGIGEEWLASLSAENLLDMVALSPGIGDD